MLKDKTVIITGAAKGIGSSIARICAREGANIGINYHKREDAAVKLKHEIEQTYHSKIWLLPFDICNFHEIKDCCDKILPDTPVHGWVNNAAVNIPGLFLTQDIADIALQIQTNLLGTINCCKYILEHMMKHTGGSIVNIGSVVRNKMGPGQSVYAASKGGISSFSRALALEHGRKDIRINCLEPGPVETSMFSQTKTLAGDQIKKNISLRRFGKAEEIAEAAVFLLSDKASYITGADIPVDGGFK